MFKTVLGGVSLLLLGQEVMAWNYTSDSKDLSLNVGGAVRTRFDFDPDRDIRKYNIDTVILKSDAMYKKIGYEVEYRFMGGAYPYNYTDNIGDINFPKKAFLKYEYSNSDKFELGLNQVPLGPLPYFTSTMMESVGYIAGIEDLYKVGLKYNKKFESSNLYIGYYWDDVWNGHGTSNGDSYSNIITTPDAYILDANKYEEKDTFVAQYNINHTVNDWNQNFGISGYYSNIEGDKVEDGNRKIFGIHYTLDTQKYGLKFVSMYQDIDIPYSYITLGGYDGTFNSATKGFIHSLDLNYKLPEDLISKNIDNLSVYANYSIYDKSEDTYKNTQQFILGSSFLYKNNFYIATEWLFGKNNPYIGGSSYVNSLEKGGTDHWENQLSINLGYYF